MCCIPRWLAARAGTKRSTSDQQAINTPALQELVAQRSQQRLDLEKPSWKMHLVDHCVRVADDCALRVTVILRNASSLRPAGLKDLVARLCLN